MSYLPIPSKLEKYLVVSEKESNSHILKAKLKCSCGSSNFKIKVFGNIRKSISSLYLLPEPIEDQYFLNLTAICSYCNKEIEVFNSLTDGYDAATDEHKPSKYVYRLVDFSCLRCSENMFEVFIKIESAGKENLINECELANWNDAFSWIWVHLLCANCGKKYSNFIDYEAS